MSIPMPMPMPICPYRDLVLEMKNLHDFSYSLMDIRPSDETSNDNKTNLT